MTDERLDQILKQALAPEIDDREIRVHRRRKGNMSKSGIVGKAVAAVVAAAIVGIGGLGYFNPALAAKIPLIGRIFDRVEDDVIYSGDYTDKETVLTNEDHAGNLDTSEYSVSDQGFTLTASEIYCDGYSIFLTVNIEAEDADFTHIPEHYTGMYVADNRTAAGFYISGTWNIDGSSPELLKNTFEGEVIDDHIFVGMLKMNLAEKFEGSGELCLNVNGLGYDDDRMLDAEEISASYWSDGRWNFVLPFEVNGTDVKTIEVGETKGNITLNDVVVSPYQVIVHLACLESSCKKLVMLIEENGGTFDQLQYMNLRMHFFKEYPNEAHIFFEAILQPQEKLRDRIQKILQPFEEINERIYRSVVSDITLRDGITEEDAIDYFRQMQRMFNGYFSSSAYRYMALDEQIREHEMNLSKLLDFMLYGIAKGGTEK